MAADCPRPRKTSTSSPSDGSRSGAAKSSDAMDENGSTSPSTRSAGRPASSVRCEGSTSRARTTFDAVRHSVSSPLCTKSTGATVRLTGTRSSKVAPRPGVLSTVTSPPTPNNRVRTTSRPTPRPDTSVTASRDEKPDWKMRSIDAASESRSASASDNRPRRTATWRSAAGVRPRPSSRTRSTTRSPSRRALKVIAPRGDFPASTRSSRASRPWSSALRTRCSSGSFKASSTERSTRSSSPSTVRSTSFPSSRASSRTMRGYGSNNTDSGTMRSAVISSERCVRSLSSSVLSIVSRRLRSDASSFALPSRAASS